MSMQHVKYVHVMLINDIFLCEKWGKFNLFKIKQNQSWIIVEVFTNTKDAMMQHRCKV